jgi:hypothetical protein
LSVLAGLLSRPPSPPSSKPVPTSRRPAFKQASKGTVSILPVDYLYWSPPLEALVAGAGSGQLWITGRASQRATAQLAALRWTIVPNSGAKLGE